MQPFLVFVALIASVIITGMISWNFIEPNSFGEAILFVVIWGILSSIFRLVAGLILMAIYEK